MGSAHNRVTYHNTALTEGITDWLIWDGYSDVKMQFTFIVKKEDINNFLQQDNQAVFIWRKQTVPIPPPSCGYCASISPQRPPQNAPRHSQQPVHTKQTVMISVMDDLIKIILPSELNPSQYECIKCVTSSCKSLTVFFLVTLLFINSSMRPCFSLEHIIIISRVY